MFVDGQVGARKTGQKTKDKISGRETEEEKKKAEPEQVPTTMPKLPETRHVVVGEPAELAGHTPFAVVNTGVAGHAAPVAESMYGWQKVAGIRILLL